MRAHPCKFRFSENQKTSPYHLLVAYEINARGQPETKLRKAPHDELLQFLAPPSSDVDSLPVEIPLN